MVKRKTIHLVNLKIKVKVTPLFKRQAKKLFKHTKKELDDQIKSIIENPTIGDRKQGDLADVFVHKFKIKTNLFLLAYTFDPNTRILIMIGSHENFYRDLKKYR
ncbi:MAG: type II toxin-antitoxin system RelE/ParE family toxin [Candidatus Marinimicrobia bacterium]|nr:type II toxin-antitoxin system RelE/ParE family toxin [Candidatus Neomarinimicrobiota bacterium]